MKLASCFKKDLHHRDDGGDGDDDVGLPGDHDDGGDNGDHDDDGGDGGDDVVLPAAE